MNAPNDSFLQCSTIAKSFGRQHVLSGLDLAVRRFERLAILGVSGCGKTTLLRIIARLDQPTSGQVTLGDRRRGDSTDSDTRVGMVFQKPAVYPHMSVRQNLAFPLRVRRRPKRQIFKRVSELAELLSLTALLDQRASRLSGGEAQRVAIGKAIAEPPSLLLLDEPVSNLHQSLRWRLMDDLRALHKAEELTTILVTHHPVDAFHFADTIAILSRGRIVQAGRAGDITSSPETLDVANLVYAPPPNVLAGCIENPDDNLGSLRCHVAGTPLYLANQAALPIPRAVAVVWRPQHARLETSALRSDEQSPHCVCFHGTIVDVGYYEQHKLVTLACFQETVRVVASEDFCLPIRTNVTIRVDPSRILFFDPGTDRRLKWMAKCDAQ